MGRKDASHLQERANRVAGLAGGLVPQGGRGALVGGSRRLNADRLRIAWYSNAPWASTGYGQQTAQLIQRFAKEDHQVAVICNYGLEGSKSIWNGFQMYPRGLAAYGDDVIVAHAMDWQHKDQSVPTIIGTLFDVWPLKNPGLKAWPHFFSWVPIDHTPAPPEVLAWCGLPNVKPVAMSKFGLRMLETAGIPAMYAPHGIEATFKPTTRIKTAMMDKPGREFMEYSDDEFVVLMVAANKGINPSRKSWAENLLAFSIFAQKHKDAVLYLYTEPDGAMGGINIVNLLNSVGIPKERYRIIDQYAYRLGLPHEVMAAIYSAADVLLACSMGEGFGIPVVEAAACGVRTIVSDFSAQPELVGEGWTVEGQPFWDAAQNAWFFTPRIPAIVDALEQAYDTPRGVSHKQIEHAKQYQADTVYETNWRPIMKELSAWCRSSSSPS